MMACLLIVTLSVMGAAEGPTLDQLRSQLDQMLAPSGLPADAGQTQKLNELAVDAGLAVSEDDDPAHQLQARLIQVRAYNALTQEAVAQHQAGMASLRLVQMRGAAKKLCQLQKQSPLPGAGPGLGDYWLLMADLIEANRNARSLDERQIAAMAQLARFVSMYAEDDTQRSPGVVEVKLALLRLYDQVGENQRAMQLMRQLLAVIEPDDERAKDFPDIAATAVLVDQPLDKSLCGELDGKSWLLLALDDALHAPNAQQWKQLQEQVSQRLSPPVKLDKRWVDAQENPTTALPQGLGDSLPRYVLVNPQGDIAAVGRTAAVLERLNELAALPVEDE
ncbi:MAG: hypothetical protein IT445_06660 [Phycisphaeraceae bacterium]|nr:hypothetical protein [Phycisphaeraceae bacterium]